MRMLTMFISLMLVMPAWAESGPPAHAGKGSGKGPPPHAGGPPDFEDGYRGGGTALPPGLQKKVRRGEELPPGWQKKVRRGEVLDSKLYERAVILAGRDEVDLPPQPGTELLRLENRIIRIKNDTREILEIFGIDTDW